ncbi:MAG: aminotransferase class I/II-fold pyridoxal phosphate-dependent enzyme, partial [Lachnospiraceae bacterium]|nr:aminotransferase class I/II-fold pyridoxal phosphate-dependent enzyme [Lachnospiraceae bacterium]
MRHGGDIYSNSVNIDFSVSLNPYVTDELKAVIGEAAAEGMASAGFYPDPEQRAVRSAIADMENVEPECVYTGSGASELLLAIARMRNPKKALLIEPCYSGYSYVLNCIRDCGIKRHLLKEDEGFCLTEDVLAAFTEDIDMVFLADPNNPTGRNIDGNLLEKILDRASELNISVVLDRSFYMLSDVYTKNTDE